jgi:hypothetical protein
VECVSPLAYWRRRRATRRGQFFALTSGTVVDRNGTRLINDCARPSVRKETRYANHVGALARVSAKERCIPEGEDAAVGTYEPIRSTAGVVDTPTIGRAEGVATPPASMWRKPLRGEDKSQLLCGRIPFVGALAPTDSDWIFHQYERVIGILRRRK